MEKKILNVFQYIDITQPKGLLYGFVLALVFGANTLNSQGIGGNIQSQESLPQSRTAPLPGIPQDNPGQGQTLPLGQEPGVRERERTRRREEIELLKAQDKTHSRFGGDLFENQVETTTPFSGGVSGNYVLGTGDVLNVYLYGTVSSEFRVVVDGRGDLVIPKLGPVRVGGLTLEEGRTRIQNQVGQHFSNTKVDVQLTEIREVRVFIMGEVYKAGAYVVQSLNSLINVLSQSGGPTSLGSYRNIRIMRGGKTIHDIDLYPLRGEGLGNLNFLFQDGDILFVPISGPQVTLMGAFQRVVHADGMKQEPAQGGGLTGPLTDAARSGDGEDEGEALEEKIEKDPKNKAGELSDSGLPSWYARFEKDGSLPSLLFELKPGETAKDALRWAGGLVAEGFTGTLSLRRTDSQGVLKISDIAFNDASLRTTVMRAGDVLYALPRRERLERIVRVTGWVRVPGLFSREDGMRVGTLLKRDQQVLPNTYLHRGEVVRTAPNGTTSYQAFDVEKALAGEIGHDLVLEDQDRIELFKASDLRPVEKVRVIGAISRAGEFSFHAGMRASDLLFKAGIPRKEANRFEAELARSSPNQVSVVQKLDLTRLLSSEGASPVRFEDDELNPLLRADDQIMVFARPDFKVHRVVKVSGQIVKPGSYALDQEHLTLSAIIKRAGGLTAEAMPVAGILVRSIGDATTKQKSKASGLTTPDPTGLGINDIMDRLNETTRDPKEGRLQKNPLLHGLASGKLNRLVVDFAAALTGDPKADLELQDGDEIIIPRKTDSAYVVGESASPFGTYKISGDLKVKDLLKMAGGTTRNADISNIRLLKADGRIIDHWVKWKRVEPGDTVLVPQRIRRDVTWQESLTALTPVAILISALNL